MLNGRIDRLVFQYIVDTEVALTSVNTVYHGYRGHINQCKHKNTKLDKSCINVSEPPSNEQRAYLRKAAERNTFSSSVLCAESNNGVGAESER